MQLNCGVDDNKAKSCNSIWLNISLKHIKLIIVPLCKRVKFLFWANCTKNNFQTYFGLLLLPMYLVHNTQYEVLKVRIGEETIS